MNPILQHVGQNKARLPAGSWESADLAQDLRVVKLPGDASTRRYFRVTSAGRTFILMVTDPFEESDFPFLTVQRYIKHVGTDVPAVLGAAPTEGMILLEDLGDVTLLHTLGAVGDEAQEMRLYQRVIQALVALQVNATQEKARGIPVPCFGMRFDLEKLMWEVNFSIQNFFEKYLQRSLTVKDRQVLGSGFEKICQELASVPTVFTHRDFHSRNIMVTPDDRLVMIDFQDARLGPPQYDLVSLLRDSYYQLEDREVEALVEFYLNQCQAVSAKRASRDDFARGFDLMTIQRNFKAIGTFTYVLNTRGSSAYLKYVGNTFENIRRALLRHPEFKALREVMFHHYYF